jgi:hypothetical protein
MTDMTCAYSGDRDDMLVACLYDEIGAAERAAFDAHLQTCARCRTELAALGGVRKQLARWNPPEPNLTINPQSATRNPPWWREVPLWAQVAAALLFLGVSAGVANLDVRYDSNGLSVRTGWMTPKAQTAAVTTEPAARLQNAATRDDLAALERQLRSEMRGAQSAPATQVRTAGDDARTRALISESEKRQRTELALRVAEVLNDVDAKRQMDLVKIDSNFMRLRSDTGYTGVQVQRQGQMLDQMNGVLRTVSQRVPQK